MANWTDAILTEKGKALAAKVMAGQLDLQLTEIWFGDGTPSTDLGNKKIKAELIKKAQEGTDCVIRFRVRNNKVQTPIIMRELGFYAIDSDGSTILFSYMTDDEPATLPRYSGGKEYRQTMTSAFGYSNAEQVVLSATILDGQTEEDVAAAIATHNTNEDAHQFLIDKINRHVSDLENVDVAVTDTIKKLSGMSKWTGIPSMPITNIINLLGQGGIVASKLDSNGYVKFANGFTIQWGDITVGSNRIGSQSFPIAFKRLFRAFAADAAWDGSTNVYSVMVDAQKTSNTTLRVIANDVNAATLNWFAIGMS